MGLNTNATWSATVKAGALHLESGLLHEIGHTLGLAHSSVSVGPLGTAIPIMAPFMNGGESHVLQSPDDRQGIESLFSFWQQMPGLAVDIGAGGASNLPQVWVISGGNSIWHYRNGSPGTFDQVPGDGAAIAVDGAGVPWVVSSNNSVWKWIGPVPPPQNAAWAWQKLPEGGVDIAAGGGQIWSISNTSDGAGNFFVKKWTGSAWDSSAGGVGVHVAVDWLGRPWVTQRNGLVWRLITSNGDINTLGTGAAAWQNIVQSDTNMSACGNDIGAGADGTVWLIGCGPVGNDFDIWLWDEQSAATSVSLQRLFIPMDGYASRITVAPNGRSWVTQSNGAIWQRAN
jgi:hypothetical protein